MQTALPSHNVPEKASSVVTGSIWMVFLTVILFFLPAINGLIGGFVGGYKVGSPGRALVAAILPSIVSGAALWGIMTAYDLPVWGLFAGFAIGIVVLLADIGIFVGAAIGGFVSNKRLPR